MHEGTGLLGVHWALLGSAGSRRQFALMDARTTGRQWLDLAREVREFAEPFLSQVERAQVASLDLERATDLSGLSPAAVLWACAEVSAQRAGFLVAFDRPMTGSSSRAVYGSVAAFRDQVASLAPRFPAGLAELAGRLQVFATGVRLDAEALAREELEREAAVDVPVLAGPPLAVLGSAPRQVPSASGPVSAPAEVRALVQVLTALVAGLPAQFRGTPVDGELRSLLRQAQAFDRHAGRPDASMLYRAADALGYDVPAVLRDALAAVPRVVRIGAVGAADGRAPSHVG